MKIKRVIGALVLIGVIIWATNYYFQKALLTSEQSISFQTAELNEKTPAYKISISYPVFKGTSAAKDASEALKWQINELIANFKNEANTALTRGGFDPDSTYSDLTIKMGSQSITNRFIGILLLQEMYIAGAAHPNDGSITFNYDLKQNKVLGISDLFEPGSAYVALLQRISSEALRKDARENGWAPEIIFENNNVTAEAFSHFTLTENGINIIFDRGTILPYALGGFSVSIPYSELKDVLNREFQESDFESKDWAN